MPTMGRLSDWPGLSTPGTEPSKGASPKQNTPPSEATIQYPPPSGVVAMPTTGWLRVWPGLRTPGTDPWKSASPKLKMPPSAATSQ